MLLITYLFTLGQNKDLLSMSDEDIIEYVSQKGFVIIEMNLYGLTTQERHDFGLKMDTVKYQKALKEGITLYFIRHSCVPPEQSKYEKVKYFNSEMIKLIDNKKGKGWFDIFYEKLNKEMIEIIKREREKPIYCPKYTLAQIKKMDVSAFKKDSLLVFVVTKMLDYPASTLIISVHKNCIEKNIFREKGYKKARALADKITYLCGIDRERIEIMVKDSRKKHSALEMTLINL